MNDSSIWDGYPVLASGSEIHINKGGGFLFLNSRLYPVGREEAEFLRRCDGSHMLKEILPEIWSEDFGDFRFLMLISQLVSDKYLSLENKPIEPIPSKIRVTGSRVTNIPPHMSIELTAGCNLRCRHCYRESDPSKDGHMPTGDLLDLLQRLRDSGLRSVELTGGEPLLHRDFKSILSFCGEKFDLVGVLSNGTLIDPDVLESFRSLKDKLVLSISLDGSHKEIHDLQRGVPGAFDMTVKGLKLLSDGGIRVRVSMTVDEGNFFDIENTLLLVKELGAVAFSYAPVLPIGRGERLAPHGLNLDAGQVSQVENDLAQKYKGFLTVMSDKDRGDLENGKSCGAGYRTYTMDPWGNIRPCATFSNDGMIIGNLMEKSIEEVFANPLTEALAQLPPPGVKVCGDCRFALFCRYCAKRGFLESIKEPDCQWIRLPEAQKVLEYWNPALNQTGSFV